MSCRPELPAEVDVLVVGLGPAGANAARAAAARGLDVLAVDRKTAPGTPVQCAEFVPTLIERPDVALAARAQPIIAMRTFVEEETGDLTPDFQGVIIDRAAFDARFAEEARAAGARLSLSTSIAMVARDGAVTLASGETVRARAVIGADGPLSAVGRAAGRVNAELVASRQITVPLTDAHEATDIFLSERLPGGYGWLFPKAGVANLGVGVAEPHRERLKPELDLLHARLVEDGRVGAEVLRVTGGPIPVGGMLDPVAALGGTLVLLAGDAAGLANPVTGAGIASAVASGRLAGEAAADWLGGDADAPEGYREDLEDLFGVSLTRALARRRRLLALSAQASVEPADLRQGWIAYPEYWTDRDVWEERHDLLKA